MSDRWHLGSTSWVIAKLRKSKRKAWPPVVDIFHSRPGSNATEAWKNATDCGIKKSEFTTSGWKAVRAMVDVQLFRVGENDWSL